MQIKISHLIWNRWNTDHIAKHQVSRDEVELALTDTKALYLQSYESRTLVLCQTELRMLAVVLEAQRKSGEYYVVTARDMAKKERSLYRKRAS